MHIRNKIVEPQKHRVFFKKYLAILLVLVGGVNFLGL